METTLGSPQDYRNIAYLSAQSDSRSITYALALESALNHLMALPPQGRLAMTAGAMQALVNSEIQRVGPVVHKSLSQVGRHKEDTDERKFWEALRGFASVNLRNMENKLGL